MMETKFYKYCLFIIAIFVAYDLPAQSVNDSSVAFKEMHQNGATDNFTAREIRKKQLQIAPSKIESLVGATAARNKEKSPGKRKK